MTARQVDDGSVLVAPDRDPWADPVDQPEYRSRLGF
jgi:hypothetical protein